jgi:hypothetical protein
MELFYTAPWVVSWAALALLGALGHTLELWTRIIFTRTPQTRRTFRRRDGPCSKYRRDGPCPKFKYQGVPRAVPLRVFHPLRTPHRL